VHEEFGAAVELDSNTLL